LTGDCVKPHRRQLLGSPRFGAIPRYARAGTMIGMRVLGVDAFTKGWIGVELDRAARSSARISRTFLTTLLSAVWSTQFEVKAQGSESDIAASCSRRSSLATAPLFLIRLPLAFTFDAHQIHPAFFLAIGRSWVASGPPCWPGTVDW
jgi:hypothetical protein